MCVARLLELYSTLPNSEDMFLRFVYRLVDLHDAAGNSVEAAFALKLHSDTLGWGHKVLHADLR
jgi:hypothetical protein